VPGVGFTIRTLLCPKNASVLLRQFSPLFVSCKLWRNICELLYYAGPRWPCPCPLAGKVNVKVMLRHIMFCGTALCSALCMYTFQAVVFMCCIRLRRIIKDCQINTRYTRFLERISKHIVFVACFLGKIKCCIYFWYKSKAGITWLQRYIMFVESKGFWRWCITLRFTRFIFFVHRSEL
jgi:hypothetical protein